MALRFFKCLLPKIFQSIFDVRLAVNVAALETKNAHIGLRLPFDPSSDHVIQLQSPPERKELVSEA